ncbi:FbpB family small basic protein (plasmid) [Bacillus megaterium]|nr:FbpB family small basic protein [Priestia megaterium]
MHKHTKSFEDLVKENKEELLKDKQVIEKLIEKRHENIKLA